MFDRSKLIQRGRFGIAGGSAVTDHVLMAIATEFENTVMRKIQALLPGDLAQRFAGNDPVLVTHKYDGEGAFVYVEQGAEPFAFSAPGGRVRVGFGALDALAAKLNAAGIRRALLRCELYLDGAADAARRSGVAEVIRVSFSGSEADLARLRLAVLDVVMVDGRDLRSQQAEFGTTLAWLRQTFGSDATALVHAAAAEQLPERGVAAAFERSVAAGGEGVVIRRLNRAEVAKVKPHRTVDALVIGYVEGDFEGQFGVTSLLTALAYAEPGADGAPVVQTFVRVGSGLTDAERVAMLDRLRPLEVEAPLPMTDSSGRAVHFIKPRLIAEVHGEDLIVVEGGREVKSQQLSWDAAAGRWRFLGLTACPRLSFARYDQLREDKDWTRGGASTAQINLPAAAPNPVAAIAETKILRREVYQKGEMLRKLVVVQKGGDLPFPYLVYWTDYSARRAEPLKVTLDVAATAERAEALAEVLLKEGVTKGFARVEGVGQ
jgi:hypothetical protein